MVYFRENATKIRMMTGGTPMTQETTIYKLFFFPVHPSRTEVPLAALGQICGMDVVWWFFQHPKPEDLYRIYCEFQPSNHWIGLREKKQQETMELLPWNLGLSGFIMLYPLNQSKVSKPVSFEQGQGSASRTGTVDQRQSLPDKIPS